MESRNIAALKTNLSWSALALNSQSLPTLVFELASCDYQMKSFEGYTNRAPLSSTNPKTKKATRLAPEAY